MQITPLHDRVLIRRIEGEEKTKGGLIVPDTAKEKPSEGEVMALGDGARCGARRCEDPSRARLVRRARGEHDFPVDRSRDEHRPRAVRRPHRHAVRV